MRERVILTVKYDQECLSQMAIILGVKLVGSVLSGYGSIGSKAESELGDTYLRMPHCDGNGNRAADILTAYQRSGVKGVVRLLAVDPKGYCCEVPYDSETPDWGSVRNFSEVMAVGMLLQLLPEAPSLTQLVSERNDAQVERGYSLFGKALREMHDQRIVMRREDRDAWLRYSAMHPIMGRERLMAIRQYIPFNAGWIDEEQFERIQGSMITLAETQVNENQDIVRVHGDSWRDNVLVVDSQYAILFDNALKYGIPGNDVAFAIGDRVLDWLTTGNTGSAESIRSFLRSYGNDSVLRDVFVGLGFKAVVGAAFDAYTESQKGKIIRWVEKIMDKKVSDQELLFSLDLAQEVWDEVG